MSNESAEFFAIIENYIIESSPAIEQLEAKRLARKLSILPSIQRLEARQNNYENSNIDIKNELKHILQRLLRVAEKKRRISSSSESSSSSLSGGMISRSPHPSSTRTSIAITTTGHNHLREFVGEAKYNRILVLVKEIRDIRRRSGVWTKFSNPSSQKNSIAEDCETTNIEGEERVSASEALPKPIFDLYFRISLMNAIARVDAKNFPVTTPMISAATLLGCPIIQRLNWDELLEDAVSKLEAFRAFERENVTKDDDLSFKCGFGFCSLDKRNNVK